MSCTSKHSVQASDSMPFREPVVLILFSGLSLKASHGSSDRAQNNETRRLVKLLSFRFEKSKNLTLQLLRVADLQSRNIMGYGSTVELLCTIFTKYKKKFSKIFFSERTIISRHISMVFSEMYWAYLNAYNSMLNSTDGFGFKINSLPSFSREMVAIKTYYFHNTFRWSVLCRILGLKYYEIYGCIKYGSFAVKRFYDTTSHTNSSKHKHVSSFNSKEWKSYRDVSCMESMLKLYFDNSLNDYASIAMYCDIFLTAHSDIISFYYNDEVDLDTITKGALKKIVSYKTPLIEPCVLESILKVKDDGETIFIIPRPNFIRLDKLLKENRLYVKPSLFHEDIEIESFGKESKLKHVHKAIWTSKTCLRNNSKKYNLDKVKKFDVKSFRDDCVVLRYVKTGHWCKIIRNDRRIIPLQDLCAINEKCLDCGAHRLVKHYDCLAQNECLPWE